MMPSPPCWASAIAMCDSVTVSMAALTIGMLRLMLRVSRVCVLALRGNHVRARGQQQNIVESKSLRNGKMNHKCLGIPQRCG